MAEREVERMPVFLHAALHHICRVAHFGSNYLGANFVCALLVSKCGIEPQDVLLILDSIEAIRWMLKKYRTRHPDLPVNVT